MRSARMTRSWLLPALGILGLLFFTGCPEPEGQGPITVDQRQDWQSRRDRDEPVAILRATSSADLVTRQRGLRVMLDEQRDVMNRLSRETSLSRVSTGMADRLRNALSECDGDLDGIARDISALSSEEGMALDDIRDQQDTLKDRLRRVAARLARMESALRAE